MYLPTQRAPLDQSHHDVVQTIMLPIAVDGNNKAMLDASHYLGLALELPRWKRLTKVGS